MAASTSRETVVSNVSSLDSALKVEGSFSRGSSADHVSMLESCVPAFSVLSRMSLVDCTVRK